MRKIYSRTFKLGGLSVSFFFREIILLYRGKNRVYLKRIEEKELFSHARKVVYGTCFLSLVLLLIMLPSDHQKESGVLVNDEEQKIKLINSRRTDFSTPRETVPLQIRIHHVRRKETLSRIAKEYGVSMDTICGSNNLQSYDMVPEGISLRVPNKDGIIYRIKKGQNIMALSRQYKIPIGKIIAENNLKNPDFLTVGKDIFIPDAKPQNIYPGFLWPCAGKFVTSGYGWRKNPFAMDAVHFHQGIDIRASYDWVKATRYGKVTFSGWLGGYGKTVVVAHPDGCKSLYGHLSKIIVRDGQYVKQGQIIARSGNTGYSSGPHLHFELIKNGGHINPHRYLKNKK